MCNKARDISDAQWLQLDIGPPTLVTGVITKGRGDSKRSHWVKRFMVSYSNDSTTWFKYQDAHHLDPKVSAHKRRLYTCKNRSSQKHFKFIRISVFRVLLVITILIPQNSLEVPIYMYDRSEIYVSTSVKFNTIENLIYNEA